MSAKPSLSTAAPPELAFQVPALKFRQPDGSLLVKAGRPEVVQAEVSIAEFHAETGVSKRYIAELCEQGHIQHRRLTPKKDSKILIPRSEIDRYCHLDSDPGYTSKTPATAFPASTTPPGGQKHSVPPREARRIDSEGRSEQQKQPRTICP